MRATAIASVPVLSLLAGCAAPVAGPVDEERCLVRVWYRPERALARSDIELTRTAAENPELVGSWNQFARPGLRQFSIRTAASGERFYTMALPLPPGSYRYGFLVEDKLLLDSIQPQSAFDRDPRYLDSGPYEAEFSLAEVPSCAAPRLEMEEASAPPDGAIRFAAIFRPGAPGGELDAASIAATLRRGDRELPPPGFWLEPADPSGSQRIVVAASGLAPSKYTLTLSVRGRDGQSPPPLTASLFVEPPDARGGLKSGARSLADAVVYHLIVDRFRGPGGALSPPKTPGHRAGGTLAGVRQAVEAGYFQRLGVTTLWLSPLYQNPAGLHTGRDGHTYEAYHGYWPSEPRTVDTRLGGAAELEALLASAHARGLRVIFDAVPNHVYETHPYYREHSRSAPPIATSSDAAKESWFSDGAAACVCGSAGCGWGERGEDCWFDTYLPDLNWRNPAVMRAGVDDLLWWLERFDLDGMRIDAVPLMPRAATRRIVRAVRGATWRSGLDLLILGEDFTGPGERGRADIRSFLGRSFDGLDSAFDFPLMWAARGALAQERMGLDELEADIARGEAAWAGSGAVIAHILDNHDTPRFISEAAGNAGNDPWQAPPQQPPEGDPTPYRKQLLGLALLFTLPGLPVLYYGDEVALAGANDPDSRRPLPDVLSGSGLLPSQAEVLAATARLGQLRGCSAALRRGTRTVLKSGRDFTVALHQHPAASPVLVVLSKSRLELPLSVKGIPAGVYHNALLLGEPPLFLTAAPASLTVRPLRPAVYLRDGDPCLTAAFKP